MARDYASLQRKPFLAPIWLSILTVLIATGCLGFAAWAAWLWATANSTTIIVVRHAESGLGESDPPLTSIGESRAQRLARMLGDTGAAGGLEAIYVSQSRRSQMTAAPLASRLAVMPIQNTTVAGPRMRTWVRGILREHTGGRILIVGERDTVPEIVRQAGGINDVPPMPEDDYATMYIVAVPRIGSANVLRLTY